MIAFFAGALYLYYVEGFYIKKFSSEEVQVPFKTTNDEFLVENNGQYDSLEVKGVDVDSSYANSRGTDYAISKEKWLEWFNDIVEMGANTINASTIFDSDFYDAFYQHNTNNEEPLYLIQGVKVADDAGLTEKDGYDKNFYDALKKDVKAVVDIIHGRKIILSNKIKGTGFYRHDISKWVVGYVIGEEWEKEVVKYTDKNDMHDEKFNGDFIEITNQGSRFEVLIAKVMEQMIGYETRKYKTQRPISFDSHPSMDPFNYQEVYAAQMNKYNNLSIEHFEPKENYKANVFASYQFQYLPDNILDALSTDMSSHIDELKNGGTLGYYELLHKYHSVPVIISAFSVPSVRTTLRGRSYTEKEQGEELVNWLKRFNGLGYGGVIISSWQDVWDRRAFHTSYAVNLNESYRWHDRLTETQHMGLLSFDVLRNDTKMLIDGNDEDWSDISFLDSSENGSYKVTRDLNNIYVLINQNQDQPKPYHVLFDTHPELGSHELPFSGKKIDEGIDFYLAIDNDFAELYVFERYQGVRQNYLESVSGIDPFVNVPSKDSNRFLSFQSLKFENEISDRTDNRIKNNNYSFQSIGRLNFYDEELHATHLDQTIDIAMNANVIELRIANGLLNVSDPINGSIHDDYYVNYGVEALDIEAFSVAVSTSSDSDPVFNKVSFGQFDEDINIEERLKASYYIVKDFWEGNENDTK